MHRLLQQHRASQVRAIRRQHLRKILQRNRLDLGQADFRVVRAELLEKSRDAMIDQRLLARLAQLAIEKECFCPQLNRAMLKASCQEGENSILPVSKYLANMLYFQQHEVEGLQELALRIEQWAATQLLASCLLIKRNILWLFCNLSFGSPVCHNTAASVLKGSGFRRMMMDSLQQQAFADDNRELIGWLGTALTTHGHADQLLKQTFLVLLSFFASGYRTGQLYRALGDCALVNEGMLKDLLLCIAVDLVRQSLTNEDSLHVLVNMAHSDSRITLTKLFKVSRRDQLISGMTPLPRQEYANRVARIVLDPDQCTARHRKLLLTLLYLLLSNCQGIVHADDCRVLITAFSSVSEFGLEKLVSEQGMKEMAVNLILEMMRGGFKPRTVGLEILERVVQGGDDGISRATKCMLEQALQYL